MPSKLKAVLFDIDDTLFDRQAAQVMCLDRLIQDYPALFENMPRETLWKAWLESDDLSTLDFNAGSYERACRSRHFLRILGLPARHETEFTQHYLRVYPTLNLPMPGALPLIHALSASLKIGVVSNSYPDVQYSKIKTLGLTSQLDCMVLSEEFGIRKPDPRVFLHACDLLGVLPADGLFVGDSFSSDIVGAKAAGMLACWLNRHASEPPKPQPAQPEYQINSLGDLLPLLQRDGLI